MSDRTRAEQDRCPNVAEHTYGPDGYIQWHTWAEKMSKTHKQSRCPGCGLWLIVHLKPAASSTPIGDGEPRNS